MKRSTTGLLAAIAVVLLAAPARAQKNSDAETMLQAAHQQETLQGDLNGAIKGYGAIVSKYARTDRAVAALALVRMADCYRKMGKTESQKIYERVLTDYADQKEAVALARSRLGGHSPSAAMVSTRVLSALHGSDIDGQGMISADGRYIPATDWKTGDLVLHEISTGVNRRLTDTKQKGDLKDFAEDSAISRDSKQVAYTWYNDKDSRHELWLANASGDPNPRRLYANPDVGGISPEDWAPDGKSIAVSIRRTDRTAQIGLVSVPDGSLRILKSIDWRGAGQIFFSPDGKYLAYDLPESDTSRDRDVFVLSVDGSREIPAVAYRGNDVAMGWSAHGDWLLFASDRTGTTDLYAVAFSDGKAQGSPQLLKADLGVRAWPLGLTRSGALYYGTGSGGAGNSKIQIASIDPTTQKLLAPPVDLQQGYQESDSTPLWSPDGKELAYLCERGPALARHGVLGIRNIQTGQVRELRPKLSYLPGPDDWSPDGRFILSIGADLQGRRGIFRVDSQTGEASPVTLSPPGTSDYSSAFSRDGKSVYFRRQFGRADFAFIQHDLASGAEKEMIRAQLGRVRLSPDGRYIATHGVDPSSHAELMLLIPTAGGEPRELMRLTDAAKPFQQGSPNISVGMWAPDSRSLLVKRNGETWRVSLDGAEPSKLDGNEFTAGVPSPDWRQLARVITEPATPVKFEFWALENFLPAKSAAKTQNQ